MTTLATFRTNLVNKLGLDSSSDLSAIDGWVNEGVTQVLLDTRCYVTSASVTPGATQDYTLTSTVLELVEAYFSAGGLDYGLERTSVSEILRMRRNGTPSTSGPARYYALAGHNTVMWYPTPSATDTLTYYYVPVPTALSASADDPSSLTLGGIPAQLHKAIEYWALSEAADYDDDQSSAQGQRYRESYEGQIRKGLKFLRRRGGLRLGRAMVGKRRTFAPTPSSDLYN